MNYIFPCTGRSGSKYISELMRSCDIHCGHEDVYRVENKVVDGKPTSTWRLTKDPYAECKKFEAESSFVLAPFINDEPCRGAVVAHIVRHPLHVIDSWRHQTHFGSFPFMATFCPFVCGDPVSWMAGLWVAWNKYIEAQLWNPDQEWHRFRVEDVDEIIDTLDLKPKTNLPSTKTNSIGSERITTLDDIKDKHIKDSLVWLAGKYGYKL